MGARSLFAHFGNKLLEPKLFFELATFFRINGENRHILRMFDSMPRLSKELCIEASHSAILCDVSPLNYIVRLLSKEQGFDEKINLIR